MKKLLVSVALIAASFMSYAQVGINTTTPEGVLDVVSENSGIILPRVANVSAVTSPVNGMMVYDLYNNCMRVFEAGIWSNCLNGEGVITPNGPPITSGPCLGQPQEFTFNGLTYKPVASNGKCWLDRNLGASQVETSPTNSASYGNFYQWGKKRIAGNQDGVNGSWDTNGGDDSASTWTNSEDPCPTGFRVPTKTQWENELNSGDFNSALKLPVAGGRRKINGSLLNVGSDGNYWSSTVDGAQASGLYFYTGYAAMRRNGRAFGESVRCIKE
jgi:hypothetical protein